VLNGGKWFADLGTPNNGGTKLYCLSGHVKKPGLYELYHGITGRELLEVAGGMRERPLKAVIPGSWHECRCRPEPPAEPRRGRAA
jgi:NADH-quinone oxidoreductase subunit F